MPVSRTRTLSSKYAGAITIRYHGRPPSRIGWIYDLQGQTQGLADRSPSILMKVGLDHPSTSVDQQNRAMASHHELILCLIKRS